jgi:hypothetical protein
MCFRAAAVSKACLPARAGQLRLSCARNPQAGARLMKGAQGARVPSDPPPTPWCAATPPWVACELAAASPTKLSCMHLHSLFVWGK